jgi:phosphoglycerate dehydrogenase-like enzyme
MGNIGRKVAKRVQAFDANVQYFDLFPLNPNVNQDLKIESVSIEVLFERSDIITSHIPLNKNTHHMVNQERLSMMKPSAILINTSRGSIIDELALIEALNQGTIAAAGLDVFEKEPVEISNPLLKMDNVIVTPHMAGTTWDTWSRRCQFGFENMKRSLVGEEISGVI